MKIMNCPNCGTPVDENNIFCPRCMNNVRCIPKTSMGKAYISMWKNAFNFKGRARRSEYWFATLANTLIGIGLAILTAIIPALKFLVAIYTIVLIVPGLSLAVRRLHDTDRRGHWLWIALTGYGAIALLVFYLQDKKQPINRFGNSNKWYSVYDLSGGEESDAV